MCKLLIFGGTTEGRLLAEYCHERKISAYVSVAGAYGAKLLPESGYLRVCSGRMTEPEMEVFIKQRDLHMVLDATHPYAAEVTDNIREACARAGVRYLRVVRESQRAEECAVYVRTAEEAVHYLKDREGRILVTTGSKELAAFTAAAGYEERVYVRVLPSRCAITACEELGIRGSHIIAMQGPFTKEMNRAIMNQMKIRYLVTKEAGAAGGFLEKLSAAEELSVISVVIGRPSEETNGISVEEAKTILMESGGANGKNSAGRSIFLIGTGMGGPGQMTISALEALKRCDVLFGARRMAEGVRAPGMPAAGILTIPIYGEREILTWLENHPAYRNAGILYSGDTGFYSGASGMGELLAKEPYSGEFELSVYPGISSVSYLCARLGRSWEHVKLVSLHGRECDVAGALREHPAVFVLLGGECTVEALCRQLLNRGLSGVTITVGERLSYPDERIVTGTPKQCAAMEFSGLAVALVESDREEEADSP